MSGSGAREPLPLPLAGEGWGRSRGFEPHAASLLSEAGMQAGLRTASEGLRFMRRGSCEARWSAVEMVWTPPTRRREDVEAK
jgi:hypothetical protein